MPFAIVPSGIIDKRMTFEEYIKDEAIRKIHMDVYQAATINI